MVSIKDLKKGDKVVLVNGWHAVLMEKPGKYSVLADVFGFEHEMGSVYCHDIQLVRGSADGFWVGVQCTPAQGKLRDKIKRGAY